MTHEKYQAFVKDMNYAAKRVASNPIVLELFGKGQLETLKEKFEAYNPKTSAGAENRSAALIAVAARIEELTAPAQVEDMSDVAKMVAENSCVLEIHVRQPGFTKKIDSATFLKTSGNKGKVEADVLHVAQDLIDKKKIKKLEQHRNELLDFIKGWRVPGGLFTPGNGQFLIPLAAIDPIYERIQEFGAARESLLDDFGKQWEEIKEDAREKRGYFYNEADYPPFSEVKARYKHDYKFISNSVPSELAKVSESIRAAEESRIKIEATNTAAEIQAALRTSFKELVQHFADRLGTDEETGKPKRFNERRLVDIKEFLDTFQARNLTGDGELAKLCDQAKSLINGVDVKQLRKDEDFRSTLKAAFDELAQNSDQLIGVRKRRVVID